MQDSELCASHPWVTQRLECLLCGVLIMMLRVTGKRDQEFDVIELTAITNLVLDTFYLLEQLASAMLISDKDTHFPRNASST